MSDSNYGQNPLPQSSNVFFNLLNTFALKYLHNSPTYTYPSVQTYCRNGLVQDGKGADSAVTVSRLLRDGLYSSLFTTEINNEQKKNEGNFSNQLRRQKKKKDNCDMNCSSTTVRGNKNVPGVLCCIFLLFLICSRRL